MTFELSNIEGQCKEIETLDGSVDSKLVELAECLYNMLPYGEYPLDYNVCEDTEQLLRCSMPLDESNTKNLRAFGQELLFSSLLQQIQKSLNAKIGALDSMLSRLNSLLEE